MSNKVLISNQQKTVKVPSGLRIMIRRSCNAVLEFEKFPSKDMPTDVLSFPLGEGGVYDHNQDTGAALLGDIVISMERAMEQAELYGHPLQREVAFLTVHSMLHLLGYDHEV